MRDLGLLLLIAVYMLPGCIASLRRKRAAWAIGALNVLLGWTLLGWVVALIWALVPDESEVTR